MDALYNDDMDPPMEDGEEALPTGDVTPLPGMLPPKRCGSVILLTPHRKAI